MPRSSFSLLHLNLEICGKSLDVYVATTSFWLRSKHKKTLISPAEMSVLKSHLNHSAAWLPVELGSMALRHQVSLILPFSKYFFYYLAGYMPSL
jgi:hypothetical protein